MSKIDLTIAIPTFNRINSLKNTLNGIKRYEGEVNLLVIDNCSTDDTQTYLSNLTFNNFVYIRNETNIGGNRNFIKCFYNINTKYIMILSDEDEIDHKNFPELLNFLKESNYPFILTEWEYLKGEKRSFKKGFQKASIGFSKRIFYISGLIYSVNKVKPHLEYIENSYNIFEFSYPQLFLFWICLDRTKGYCFNKVVGRQHTEIVIEGETFIDFWNKHYFVELIYRFKEHLAELDLLTYSKLSINIRLLIIRFTYYKMIKSYYHGIKRLVKQIIKK